MCVGEPLLVPCYLLSSFPHSLILYHSIILSFYHFMCDFNKIGVYVCVKWEKKVQHVKNKYNGFWLKVKIYFFH
jgi:hypothetical protein